MHEQANRTSQIRLVDVIAPCFCFSQGQFIVHPRMRRKPFAEFEYQASVGAAVRDHSITVGKMPNRQVTMYDKSRDVRDKNKVEWPEIWNTCRKAKGLCALDYFDPTNRVWRIELRVGKKYLTEQWHVSGWDSLFLTLPPLLSDLAASIRFAQPNHDSNRSRWPSHPVWLLLNQIVPDAIFDEVPDADKSQIIEIKRIAKQEILERQLLGLAISLAAFHGMSATDFPPFLRGLPKSLLTLSDDHPKSLQERLAQAAMRHVF